MRCETAGERAEYPELQDINEVSEAATNAFLASTWYSVNEFQAKLDNPGQIILRVDDAELWVAEALIGR